MPRIGPDISHHQERVDLARAKPNVDFMFLKATDGTKFVDKTFGTRWRKLAELGIPRGAYHFARPGNASVQAAHFVEVVKRNGFRAGDVAILDVEDPSDDPDAWEGTSPQALRALVDRFFKDVRHALSVENVVLYTGLPFWRDRMGSPAKLPTNCIGWLTRYRKAGPYGGSFPRPAAWPNPPDIWQFTDGTAGNPRAIPGIGKVDCNEMTEACFQRLFKEQDDITKDELLDALASAPGKKVLQDAVRPVVQKEVLDLLRAGFGGLQPGATSNAVRNSQMFLYETVQEINSKLPKS